MLYCRQMTVWDKLSNVAIGIAVAVFLGAMGAWYVSLIPTENQLRKQIYSLDLKIEEQKRVARQLEQMRRAMREDRQTVERLARERLGLGRPNETVFRFEEPANR